MVTLAISHPKASPLQITEKQSRVLAWTLLCAHRPVSWLCRLLAVHVGNRVVGLPTWEPHKDWVRRRSLRSQSWPQIDICWSPGWGLLPPHAPWLVTVIHPSVHLTKTYQANACQHKLLTWELRGKPHKCEKSELVLKGLNVKVCGPEERLLFFFPFVIKDIDGTTGKICIRSIN